ncbi:MAG TPA: biotin/lipoyl-binding protein, partial [Longimicrobium sp.]
MRKLTLFTLLSAGAIGIVLVAAAAAGADEAPAVQTEPVTRRNLVSAVPGSGRIEPKRKVDISADITGRVIELAVQEGAWVNRGDLLLRIDPARYQAALVRAEAALAQAQATAENARTNQLYTESELRRMGE